MKLKIPAPKLKNCSISSIFKELGKIDKRVEAGKITPRKHDSLTKEILRKCMR